MKIEGVLKRMGGTSLYILVPKIERQKLLSKFNVGDKLILRIKETAQLTKKGEKQK